MTLAPRLLPAIALRGGSRPFDRADIVVDGLDLAGPSYELRVFLNNPEANAQTEPTPDNGYAGSIYVYGYGQPPETVGKSGRPRMPMSRSMTATDAVRAAAGAGSSMSVTLVAVPFDPPDPDIDLDTVVVSILLDEPPPEVG